MSPERKPPSERQLLAEVAAALDELTPPDWSLTVEREPQLATERRADAVLTLTAPDGESAIFVAEIKRDITGRRLQDALNQANNLADAVGAPASPLIVTPWLSTRSRQILADAGASYADATGNVRLVAQRPAVFVTATGAPKNPWPVDKTLRSLRGKRTMRALRALVEVRPPYGLRELATRTNTSAATLSRVLDLLDRENLVERAESGAVVNLDWAGAIRRWAEDYDVLETNRTTGCLAPRGLSALEDSLRSTRMTYALTGSLAARELAPIAPARLAMVYADEPDQAVSELGLSETDAGTNVLLLEPYDSVVFERPVDIAGLNVVNPSQLAVDLLTSPGRGPAEGEELLSWMEDNEDAWRT